MANLEEVATALCEVLPQYNLDERRLALKLYRLLAEGKPVPVAKLAAIAGTSESTAVEILEGAALKPNTLVDDAGNIVGFGGLAVTTMYHRLIVRQRTLYTWCAWDAFFIPAILGESVRLESRCPETWQTVSMTIGPDGLSEPSHVAALVSFVVPEKNCADVHAGIANFCQKVFLLASPEAASSWAARNRGSYLLTLNEALELGRIKNAMQFEDALS